MVSGAAVLLTLVPFTIAGEGGPMTDTLPALPEGQGLAARYPGDQGIEADPAVVFTDDFETTPAGVIPPGIPKAGEKKWDNSWGDCLVTADPESVHSGRQGLNLTVVAGPNGPGPGLAVQKYFEDGFDTLFMRYYAKFGADSEFYHGGGHNGPSIAGRGLGVPSIAPGIRADGGNQFICRLDTYRAQGDVPSPGDLVMYVYHMDQGGRWGDQFYPSGRVNPPGRELFGEQFVPREDFIPERGRWYCYELMVKANAPGARDGRVAVWVDGQLRADFPNLRLRNVESLKANRIDMTVNTQNRRVRANVTMCYDDVVVATSYVGPQAGDE
jgi:hypothetical protein